MPFSQLNLAAPTFKPAYPTVFWWYSPDDPVYKPAKKETPRHGAVGDRKR